MVPIVIVARQDSLELRVTFTVLTQRPVTGVASAITLGNVCVLVGTSRVSIALHCSRVAFRPSLKSTAQSVQPTSIQQASVTSTVVQNPLAAGTAYVMRRDSVSAICISSVTTAASVNMVFSERPAVHFVTLSSLAVAMAVVLQLGSASVTEIISAHFATSASQTISGLSVQYIVLHMKPAVGTEHVIVWDGASAMLDSQGSTASPAMQSSMVRHAMCIAINLRHVAIMESAVPMAHASAMAIIMALHAIRAHRTSMPQQTASIAAFSVVQILRAVGTENARTKASAGVRKIILAIIAANIATRRLHVPEMAIVLQLESANATTTFSHRLALPTATPQRIATTTGGALMVHYRHAFATSTTMVNTAIRAVYLQHPVHAT